MDAWTELRQVNDRLEQELAAAHDENAKLRELAVQARADVAAVYYEAWDSARRTVAEAALARIDAALASLAASAPASGEQKTKPADESCLHGEPGDDRCDFCEGRSDSSAGLLVPADTIEKALYDMDDGAIDAGLTASRKLGALRPDLGLAEHAAVFRAAALAAVCAPKEDEA